MVKVLSSFTFFSLFFIKSLCFAAQPLITMPSIVDGLTQQLPVFQVNRPFEFSHITKARLLKAAATVRRYNAYGLDPNKVYPDDPNMNGFTYPEQKNPLPELWKRFCYEQPYGINVLDAHLSEKDRKALVPHVLRQSDTKHDGSLVMSPAGFYTPTHLDDSFSRSYNGVWMYLVQGQKEWLFVHRRTMLDVTKQVTLKQCRAMDINTLYRLCAKTKNPLMYRYMLYPGTFLFFEGHAYYHCVQTRKASLGISGFSVIHKPRRFGFSGF